MKRVLSILMLVIMTVALLSGCGGNTNSSSTSNTSNNNLDSEAKTEEKVTIRVFGPSNVEEFPPGEDENNNRIIQFLEEATGYDLVWEIAPQENAREKINLMVTSGTECPDLIVSGDRNMGLDFIKEGLLYPLDEYIQNTKNLKRVLDEKANKMMMHEGKMYAIVVPQNQESTTALAAREDWLTKVGITKIPSTLDEIREALEAFKQNDPSCIPLTGVGENPLSGLTAFRGAFGVATEYRIAGDKLEPTYITEDMKNFLAYFADLYKNGLLDPEFAVNKSDKVNEKIVSGRAGMVSTWWHDMKNRRDALAEKDPNAKFVYINPVGPDGRSGQLMNTPARTYFFIPIHSKIPEKVIDFIDKYVDEEVRMVVSYGWEGEHYTINSEGLIEATPKAEEIRYRIYYQLWDTKEDFINRVQLKGFAPDYFPMKEFATIEDPMWYAPLIPIKQEKNQVLSDLTNEYFLKIITNALPLDAFDEYVEKWKAAGGDEVLKAVNEWYATTK